MRVRLVLLTLAAAGAAGLASPAAAAGGCSYVVTGWPAPVHTVAVCAQDNPPATTPGGGTPLISAGAVCVVGSVCTPPLNVALPVACTSGTDNAAVFVDGTKYTYPTPVVCTP